MEDWKELPEIIRDEIEKNLKLDIVEWVDNQQREHISILLYWKKTSNPISEVEIPNLKR